MIQSKIIIDLHPPESALIAFRKAMPEAQNKNVTLCIFQTTVTLPTETRKIMCCWAGGKFIDGEQGYIPLLSDTGKLAVETMLDFAVKKNPKTGIIFQG